MRRVRIGLAISVLAVAAPAAATFSICAVDPATGEAGVALAILAGALLVGVLGYRGLGRLPWIDAILNASMILSGMGPVAELESDGAKLFASVYALFSGVVFLAVTGLVLAPVLHRLLHRLHLDDGDD